MGTLGVVLLASRGIQAEDGTILTVEINLAAEDERRDDIRRAARKPPLLALGTGQEETGSIRSHTHYAATLCRRHNNEPGGGHGRGNEA